MMATKTARTNVLTPPCLHHIVIRPKGQALALVEEGVGILFDNWKSCIDMIQPGIGQFIRLCHVRLHVAVWCLEIWFYRLAEFLVSAVGDLEGLLSNGMLFELLDPVMYDGIAGGVGNELGRRLLAVRHRWRGHLSGCVRHGLCLQVVSVLSEF